MNRDTPTTPAINLIKHNRDLIWYLDQYMNMHKFICEAGFKGNLVKYHKHIFGKQDYCFNGSVYRLWVWEKTIGNRGWRVYVGNQKGACFEVHKKCSHNETMLMVDDYLSNVLKVKE